MLMAEKFPNISDVTNLKESRAGGLVNMGGHSKGGVKPHPEIFNQSYRATFSITNCDFIVGNVL